jgi:thiamine biosynthesis lipoprotein
VSAQEGVFRRVEHHMSTAITLLGTGIDDAVADAFFDRIRHLEDVLSRFREHSDLSRLARGEVGVDRVDPAVTLVLSECDALRNLTRGDFEHEPRRRPGSPDEPVLDVDALAKGWIVEDAATVLRMSASAFLVNAGGDVIASAKRDGTPWRVAIQHPTNPAATLGVFEVKRGAVATSGTYERGAHIRAAEGADLVSVTVVGPDLGLADGISTAVFAAGQSPPAWWPDVDPAYGLLTVASDGRLRWLPPRAGSDIDWCFPSGSVVRAVAPPS